MVILNVIYMVLEGTYLEDVELIVKYPYSPRP